MTECKHGLVFICTHCQAERPFVVHSFGTRWLHVRDECACEVATRLADEAAERVKWALIDRRNSCNLPYDLRDAHFTDVEPVKGIITALKQSRRFVATWPHRSNLVLSGVVGCGKTLLSACVANALMEDRWTVEYVNLIDFFRQVKSTWNNASLPAEMRASPPPMPGEVSLLILDELGSEPAAWQQEHLYAIIDSRYVRGRPLLVTTNARTRAELGQAIGARSLDRILHPSEWVDIKAVSYRTQQRAKCKQAGDTGKEE